MQSLNFPERISKVLSSIKNGFNLINVVITTFYYWICEWFAIQKRPVFVEGFVKNGFENVQNVFRENLESGWEPDGASLAIYQNGKLVVDLWGGYSDKESRRKWTENTLAVIFSSTKAISALCIGLLVDRDLIKYEDKLISFWPEFGKNGKESITIQWILSHTAGLAWTDAKITFDNAKDWRKMSELFENETPKWEPGTAVGYHAITYGWLVDQIIRRVDPKHRSIGQFFREEFQQPLGLDLHIGLPKSEAYRVARIRLPSFYQRICEYFHNPDAVNYPKFLYEFAIDGMISKVEKNPDWLRFVKEMTLNNPEIYELEQGAVMGISTSKSLAKLFSVAIIEKKMFKEETIQKMLIPFNYSKDIITGALVSRGQGLMFSDFQTKTGIKGRIIGHAGYGGQNIKFDPKYKVSFAYLSNGLKAGFGDSARTFVRLSDSIYDVLTRH